MNTATFNVFLLMFQSYGVTQGAAMAIVFNWDMLSFVPMIGLNIAVMSLIGRFVEHRVPFKPPQLMAGYKVGIAFTDQVRGLNRLVAETNMRDGNCT